MKDYLEIDGNYLEGGGQIVRTALGLSAITGKPFIIKNIRAGRKTPGLKAQHVAAIKAYVDLCGAKVKGGELGSSFLQFTPGKIKPKSLSLDIGTAGSITLLLQSLLIPCIAHGGKFRITIQGGTDVAWSMPIDFLKFVLIPHLRRLAIIDITLEKRGYYPKGGGRVDIKIKGREDKIKINLTERGIIHMIKGISHSSRDLSEARVAERTAHSAKMKLLGFDVPVKIINETTETYSTGSGVTVYALCSLRDDDINMSNPIILGADSLGEKGKSAESVGEDAGKKLAEQLSSYAAVDEWTADNLVPYLGIFGGTIKVSNVSDHTKSNIYVTEKFLDKKFKVEGNMISVE